MRIYGGCRLCTSIWRKAGVVWTVFSATSVDTWVGYDHVPARCHTSNKNVLMRCDISWPVWLQGFIEYYYYIAHLLVLTENLEKETSVYLSSSLHSFANYLIGGPPISTPPQHKKVAIVNIQNLYRRPVAYETWERLFGEDRWATHESCCQHFMYSSTQPDLIIYWHITNSH